MLAELDITERRVPQDGRFKALERGRAVDFRVSIMPSIHGEDAVLRVLDKQSLYEQTQQQLSLDSLGFEPDDVKRLRRLSREPYGMLLVTGPTGSGKTTTLYAAITEINNGQDKIVTIEDPVEYQLAGVLQIPVNEKKGLTFARGLRSILRHDPDKIMVGEIRDPETANIAVQSALTGHLVFTTVHANNVFDVIGRFMHMNVDLYGFVSALNAILAQRLVRLVCPHCAEHDAPDDGAAARVRARRGSESQGWKFTHRQAAAASAAAPATRAARRSPSCMILNDEMRELITGARAGARSSRRRRSARGTRFLRDAAFDAVQPGRDHAAGDQPCHVCCLTGCCLARPAVRASVRGWRGWSKQRSPATRRSAPSPGRARSRRSKSAASCGRAPARHGRAVQPFRALRGACRGAARSAARRRRKPTLRHHFAQDPRRARQGLDAARERGAARRAAPCERDRRAR